VALTPHTRTAPTHPPPLPPRVAVANFEVYYELDDDLSRHVLDVASYVPDGPDNSWVLLERDQAEPGTPCQAGSGAGPEPEVVIAEVAQAKGGTVQVEGAAAIEDAD